MIALLVPTGLVLASQDALPGDSTYPLKRKLENVVIQLSSRHPVTQAYFGSDLSKRRFKEAVALIKRGDNASGSLNELVDQTQSAADSMKGISDSRLRKQMAANFSNQIDDYQKSLIQIEQEKKAKTKAIILPSTPWGESSQLVTPTPNPAADINYKQTIEELEKIRKELEQVKQQLNSQNQGGKASESITPTLSPTPSPTVIPTPTPSPTPASGTAFMHGVSLTHEATTGGIAAPTTSTPIATLTATLTPTLTPILTLSPSPTGTGSGQTLGIYVRFSILDDLGYFLDLFR